MLFDDAFLEDLPVDDRSRSIVMVYRHFRDFDEEICEQERKENMKLVRDGRFDRETFDNYIRAFSFLQSFSEKHKLKVNISHAPLSASDLMDQQAFVDRVRDAYGSLQAVYYESVADLSRNTFSAALKGEEEKEEKAEGKENTEEDASANQETD
ncbi:MAG: hypothetical protein ACOC29_02015 [Candidatus Sumerlaeota bacterium]